MFRFILIGLCLCWPFFASAQQNSAFARMNQDMLLLNEEVGKLRLQVEDLQRQQAQMMKNYEALLKSQSALTSNLNAIAAQNETKFEALPQREAALKREIATEVTKQIEALAKETQAAIDLLAKAQGAQPNISPKVEFSENYPSTGYSHVVKSGETISGIARKYGSSTTYIINANRIPDARGLRAGETIFIPVDAE